MNAEKIKSELDQFRGTEQYYKTNLPDALYTDGVKAMAELCEAYWLVTDATIYGRYLSKKGHDFIVINLKKIEGDKATLTYEDGNKNVLRIDEIPFTDFPLETFKLYYTNNVLLLPSEY